MVQYVKSSRASSPNTKIQDVPNVPTIGSVSQNSHSQGVDVAFTPAATGGRAAVYRAVSSPGGIEGISYGSSPVLVTGLTDGTPYTFTVRGETSSGATSGYSTASSGITPQIGAYDLISTSLITSPTGNFNIENIPQTYKHLQLRITMRGDGASVAFGGAFDFHPISGGSTYSQQYLQNSGSSVTSVSNTNLGIVNFTDMPAGGAGANIFGAVIMDIIDYTSTAKNKTVKVLGGYSQDGTYNRVDLRAGLWVNAGAVTSIRFRPYGTSNFVAGSRFSLYGIRG